MRYRSSIGTVLLILSLLIVFTVLGCTPDEQPTPQDTPSEGNGDESTLNGDEETEPPVDTTSAGDSPVPEPAGDPVTQEDLEQITGFGAFMFPDAILNESTSMHSTFSEGTEQYLLHFVCEVSIETVVDWYTDNLEPGTTKNSVDRGDGNMIFNFVLNPEETNLVKNVFIMGESGGPGCEVTVNMWLKPGIPAADDESEPGSE